MVLVGIVPAPLTEGCPARSLNLSELYSSLERFSIQNLRSGIYREPECLGHITLCSLSDAVPRTEGELRRLQHLARDKFQALDMDVIRRGERVLVLTHGDAWPNNVLVRCDDQVATIPHVPVPLTRPLSLALETY